MGKPLACLLRWHYPFMCLMMPSLEPFPFLHRCMRCGHEWQDYGTLHHLWHRPDRR